MEKKFTEEASLAVNIAFSEAARLGNSYVGSEHLLIGLVLQNGETGKLIVSSGGALSVLRTKTEAAFCTHGAEICADMTPKLKRILMKAAAIAGDGKRAGGAHLLSAMLSEDCTGKRIAEAVCDTENLYSGLKKLLLEDKMLQKSKKTQTKPTPLLDKNGKDLTEKATRGEIDPVIGREKEVARVIQILLRRNKNNPCLVGEPGVGKTAVAEAVALLIAEGAVPEPLKNKRLVALDLPSLIAGTKYRGEFEDKLRGVIEEVQLSENVILFADELHTIVGAGAAEGAIDASNILKPYLARGELQLIGATTLKEYKRYIEKDGALERRFQRVLLEEPTVEQCVEILRGIKPNYEKHHGVKIDESALYAAAELSERFVTDRHLPDKAIDLMDEAAANKQIDAKRKKHQTVTRDDIEAALEAQIGVRFDGTPLDKAAVAEVKECVCGQNAAVDTVVAALNRCRAGYCFEEEAPLCSFLFTGERGTGKTRLAKETARLFFGSDRRFKRFDMAEYTEPQSLTRLTGAAPGYSGCEDGGVLTEWVRKAPYSLLLFDNADSACAEALALIRRILQEGCLYDGAGSKISFRGCLVVVAADTDKGASAGFCTSCSDKPSPRLQGIAELVEEWVRFKTLDGAALARIARLYLAQTNARLAPLGIRIGESAGFAESLGADCASRGMGAAALRARISRQAKALLANKNAGNALLFYENGVEKAEFIAKNC